jgi:multidrug efflux pump subunit AcrB
LLAGLCFSILLVYLLIVVNFQSWLDPFIIVTALPAALAGIVLCLFFTGTTLSVPALMGAITCMGVRHRQQHPHGVVCPRAARGPWGIRCGPQSKQGSLC